VTPGVVHATRSSVQARLEARLGSANEARWMVDHVVGRRGEVDELAARTLRAMASRRLAGEPLQYVLGTWPFRTVELAVDTRALIPRPETEQVVELALAEARRQLAGPVDPAPHAGPFAVADLGTGTGAIALSIAAEIGPVRPDLRVSATDVDPDALELAAANRRRVARDHPHVVAQVELRAGSWFDALDPEWRGTVRLVVSNPPYVSEDEWETLDPQVRREPYRALVAPSGSDGTPGFAAVEAVAAGAARWLAPGGAVVVEISPHQASAAERLAARSGYRGVRLEPDLAGRARALVARR